MAMCGEEVWGRRVFTFSKIFSERKSSEPLKSF
jgi:hypothetical protein